MSALNDFLRHLAERDVPDDELKRLKAAAFDECALAARRNGDDALAVDCERAAERART